MKAIRVEDLRGHVVRDEYARGTKSHHQAVFLETQQGKRLRLRRKDGPAFADPSLTPFVGQDVQCTGFLVDDTLLAERIEEIRK